VVHAAKTLAAIMVCASSFLGAVMVNVASRKAVGLVLRTVGRVAEMGSVSQYMARLAGHACPIVAVTAGRAASPGGAAIWPAITWSVGVTVAGVPVAFARINMSVTRGSVCMFPGAAMTDAMVGKPVKRALQTVACAVATVNVNPSGAKTVSLVLPTAPVPVGRSA